MRAWVILAGIVTASVAWAIPARIPFQAYLTDAQGTPRQGDVTLSLALYPSATANTPLYWETQTVAVDAGLVTLEIGASVPLDLDLFAAADAMFLGVTVVGDEEMTPRLRIGTAPYAAYANQCADALSLQGQA